MVILLMCAQLEFDIEMDKAVEKIRKNNYKKVCIQLPDGMKPHANRIAEELNSLTGAQVLIWAGSCYGACDVPLHVDKLGVDILIQWGHSRWQY